MGTTTIHTCDGCKRDVTGIVYMISVEKTHVRKPGDDRFRPRRLYGFGEALLCGACASASVPLLDVVAFVQPRRKKRRRTSNG